MKKKRKRWKVPRQKIHLRQFAESVVDLPPFIEPISNSPPKSKIHPIKIHRSPSEGRILKKRRKPRSFNTKTKRKRLIGRVSKKKNPNVKKRRKKGSRKKKKVTVPSLTKQFSSPKLSSQYSSPFKRKRSTPPVEIRKPVKTVSPDFRRSFSQVELRRGINMVNKIRKKRNDFSDNTDLESLFGSLKFIEQENQRTMLKIRLSNVHVKILIEKMNEFNNIVNKSVMFEDWKTTSRNIVFLHFSVLENKSKYEKERSGIIKMKNFMNSKEDGSMSISKNGAIVRRLSGNIYTTKAVNKRSPKSVTYKISSPRRVNFNDKEDIINKRDKSVTSIKKSYNKLSKNLTIWFLELLMKNLPKEHDQMYYNNKDFVPLIRILSNWIKLVLQDHEIRKKIEKGYDENGTLKNAIVEIKNRVNLFH